MSDDLPNEPAGAVRGSSARWTSSPRATNQQANGPSEPSTDQTTEAAPGARSAGSPADGAGHGPKTMVVRRRTTRRVVPAESTGTPARPARMAWRRVDGIVALVFLLGGYLVTSQMWSNPTGHTTAANGTDQTFFEWMLVHGLRVFTHGDNPLFTSQLNAPLGVNLMSNTGLLGLSLPFAPVTALIGPGPTFVLLIMLGLAGTAFSWYYVLSRHFIGQRFAAFVGGAVCGFGPGIVTHANAHPNLTAGFLVPLILWRALALRSSRQPVRDGVILGLLAAYQVFINEEVLFLTALGGTVFVLAYVAFRPAEVREAVRPIITGLGTAIVLACTLIAYPLYFQFFGPQHFSGLPTWLEDWPYRLPLESYVTLPQLSLWGNPARNLQLATQTEENSFLGWPLVLVSVAIVVALWRSRLAVRALGITGVLFAWASLGDAVVFRDPAHSYRELSLWRWFSKLPLFDSVLPSRLGMVVLPIVGLLLAIAVRDCLPAMWNTDGQPTMRVAGAVCALAAIVASVVLITPRSVPVAPRTTVPQFFTSGAWRPYVPAGASVISASPYVRNSIPYMRWAIASGLDFSVPGGYFLGPEGDKPQADKAGAGKAGADQAENDRDSSHPRGQFGPVMRTTEAVMGSVGIGTWSLPQDTAYWTTQAVCDFRYWHTAIVVLDPKNQQGARTVKQTMDRLIGTGRAVDDVILWDVRWTWNAPVACSTK